MSATGIGAAVRRKEDQRFITGKVTPLSGSGETGSSVLDVAGEVIGRLVHRLRLQGIRNQKSVISKSP